MRAHRIPADEWQYGDRSTDEVRGSLLRLTLEFVRSARAIRGVERIAVVGSLLSLKARPKDADVLVTIALHVDLDALARVSRRFQGRAQGINSTADVFLADTQDEYLGRICHYRACHPRVLCHARHCGTREHLNDDLDILMLARDLVASPPLVVHPVVRALGAIPEDVETLLLAPIRNEARG